MVYRFIRIGTVNFQNFISWTKARGTRLLLVYITTVDYLRGAFFGVSALTETSLAFASLQ